MRRVLDTIIILFVVALSASAQQIEFHKASWTEVKKLAHENGKSIFVDVYTSWCGPCEKMASTVFTDPSVGTYMNEHFVSIQLDAEKEKDYELFKMYQPNGYPSFYWFDAEGTLLDTQVGYMPAEEFIGKSKKALESNLGKQYKVYNERWQKGERDYEFVKEFLFDIMPRVQADSVRSYLNAYLEGLSVEELKSRQTGELIRGFLRGLTDDTVWRTLVTYNDIYESYFGVDFGKRMYMNLVRIPMADRNDEAKYKKDLACIASVDFPRKQMYQELLGMETILFEGKYTEALKQALSLGNKYEKDVSYLYSEMFYTCIIAKFFEEGYTPTLEEQKQILMLAQKAFDLMPSQCTLMYLAAAYARNNNFRQAYECLASMPFYGAPVLSSAVYHLLNLKRIFPSTKK